MVNAALLGCAHIHTPGLVKMLMQRPDARVKSVWDHDSARGARNADDLRARFCDDYRTILCDPDVQAIIILSETNLHEQLVTQTTQARKHLFVEKPLGRGAHDANLMADAIERAGVLFQSGYSNRGIPSIQFIRERLGTGAFGTVTRARYCICHRGALEGWFDGEWRWMANLEQAGVGAFGDLGTHGLDTLIWLFGEVDRVTACFGTGSGRYPGCEETGEAILVFKNGTIATLAAGWDDLNNPVLLEISGTDAHAAVIHDQLYLTDPQLEGADGRRPFAEARLPRHWPHALNLFLDAVSGKADVPLVSAREAACRSIVMEAIYQANHSRQWVSVVPRS